MAVPRRMEAGPQPIFCSPSIPYPGFIPHWNRPWEHVGVHTPTHNVQALPLTPKALFTDPTCLRRCPLATCSSLKCAEASGALRRRDPGKRPGKSLEADVASWAESLRVLLPRAESRGTGPMSMTTWPTGLPMGRSTAEESQNEVL